MESFRSRNYPSRKSPFVALQESAMPFYGGFMLFVMAVVILRMNSGHDVLWFGTIGALLSVILGNFFAQVRMRRQIAEIFFTGETFSIISIYDIIYKQPAESFPLRFANPTRTNHEIQLHYKDQVMQLHREDWGEEFDLIWNWLIADRSTPESGFTQTATW